jgi:acyl-CoA oxidase
MCRRLAVTRASVFQLAQAVTIATRYSTVREQGLPAFSNEKVAVEMPLMHYNTQRYRLLTSLANAYAMLSATRCLDRAYRDFERRQAASDYTTMGDFHALSAGIKALATTVAHEGAVDARKACGGHGYLGMSGLPDIVDALDALCTLEGDNIVMLQQTARWLIKLLDQQDHQNCPAEARYLLRRPQDDAIFRSIAGSAFLDPEMQIKMFRHCVSRGLYKTYDRLREGEEAGKTKAQAWNENMRLLVSAAYIFIECLSLGELVREIDLIEDERIRTALDRLRCLFALSRIAKDASFRAANLLDEGQLNEIHDLVSF